MKKYHFDWSFGNSKLAKEGTVAFNIPALRSRQGFTTCPSAGICAALCYAQQGRYNMPDVIAVRERNLAKLLGMTADHTSTWGWVDVEAQLIMDVQAMPPRIKQIRIHDSGDFYDKEYFYTWCRVADACRDYVFYAYTKQIGMYANLLGHGKIPTNLFIVQSVGGKDDDLIDPLLPHSRIFPTKQALDEAGYLDGTHTDKPVYTGGRCIGLVYHGSKKLTEAQATNLTQISIDA